MKYLLYIALVMYSAFIMSCNNNTNEPIEIVIQNDTLYRSEHLTLIKLTDHVVQHISHLKTNDFGTVPCNGMIVVNRHKAFVFDTPTNKEATEELIKYFKQQNFKVKGVIATHFHDDCIAGIDIFKKNNIKTYAYKATLAEMKLKEIDQNVPEFPFSKDTTFSLGFTDVEVKYLGAGHTKDNIVAYVPKDHVLFGGCLVKEMNANKGNLADANQEAWSNTIDKIIKTFPGLAYVIVGHGQNGKKEVLEYTRELFYINRL